MIKKTVLISLSLVVFVSLFLVGCGNQNAFAGQGWGGSSYRYQNPSLPGASNSQLRIISGQCTELEECGLVKLSELNNVRVDTLSPNPNRWSCDDLCRDIRKVCVGAYHKTSSMWTPSRCQDIVGTDPISCRCY